MPRDVAEIVEEYLSEDPIRWGKLASDVQFRRLQLLLLREILVELRKLNREGGRVHGDDLSRSSRLENG